MAGELNEAELRAYENEVGGLLFEPAEAPGGEALEITGLEILAFIAAKVALPALAGFVGRALYEKWSKPLTRSDLDALRKELIGKRFGREPAVPREELIAEAAAKLVAEGLDDQKARQIAGEIVDRAARKARQAAS